VAGLAQQGELRIRDCMRISVAGPSSPDHGRRSALPRHSDSADHRGLVGQSMLIATGNLRSDAHGHMAGLAGGYVNDAEQRDQQLATIAGWKGDVERLVESVTGPTTAPVAGHR
jgi:hypothetical protein